MLIGVYIGSIEELCFFLRMADTFACKGYRFCFLSNKLSLIVRLILKGRTCRIVFKNKWLNNIPDLSGCFEYRRGFISYQEARELYSSVFHALNKCSRKSDFEYLFIWNGLSVQTMAVSDYAKLHRIKTRYFELSNLPGTVFSDPEGVNAKASIYRDITILEKFSVSSAEYREWKSYYLQWKTSQQKSSNKINKKINYLFLLDLIGFYFLNISKSGEIGLLNKVKELFSKSITVVYDDYNIFSGRFIFLPLQVNYDTQLIFNSDIGNLEAVIKAAERAKESNADLLVKIHPLEFDKEFIKQLYQLKEQLRFFIINNCINELIMQSLYVICINSTAGLEAKILGKKVEFLGRSIYSALNEELIKNYILGYLLTTEYLSSETIEEKVIDKLISLG